MAPTQTSERVGERHADLEDVGARARQAAQEVRRAIEVRVSCRHVRDESRLPGLANPRERAIDARFRAVLARLPRHGPAGWLTEFAVFGLKQAWACVFGGAMLAVIFAAHLWYPRDPALARNDFEDGCPVAAAALSSPETTEARAVAARAFSRWQQQVAASLVARGHDPAEAADVAGLAIAAVEGALIVARAQRSTEPLERVARQLSALLADRR